TLLGPGVKLRAGGLLIFYYFQADSEVPFFQLVKTFPSPLARNAPTRKDAATIPSMQAAIYGELEIHPLPKLTLFPGVRIDLYDFKSDPGTLVDPRLVEG